jgi:hypothetical protein
LKKSEDRFQVIFPPEGFSRKLMVLIISLIIFVIFLPLALCFVSLFIFLGNVSIAFPVALLGSAIAISLTISAIIYCIFGSAILTIDDEEISLHHRIFGINLPKIRKMERENINKIQRLEKSYIRDSKGTQFHVTPALTIWAGTKEYKISSQLKGYLTQPELDWLAAELSEWLGMEVSSNLVD